MPGLSVLNGIGDRLLGDLVELEIQLLRKLGQRVSHLQAAGQWKSISHSGYEFFEHEPDISATGIERAETVSQIMRVIDDLVQQLLDFAGVCGFGRFSITQI